MVHFLLSIVPINTPLTYTVLAEKYWSQINSRYDCGILTKHQINLEISPIGRAVRMRKLEILDILLRHPHAQVTLDDLHYCILEGDSLTANMILGKIDQNILPHDTIKGTEIHVLHQIGAKACFKENTKETIKLLGFDINLKSWVEKDGKMMAKTLLDVILSVGPPVNYDLVRYLVFQGVDPFC